MAAPVKSLVSSSVPGMGSLILFVFRLLPTPEKLGRHTEMGEGLTKPYLGIGGLPEILGVRVASTSRLTEEVLSVRFDALKKLQKAQQPIPGSSNRRRRRSA
jgi:hypothetical protein